MCYIFALNKHPQFLQWNSCFPAGLWFTKVRGLKGFRFRLVLVFPPTWSMSALLHLGHFIFDTVDTSSKN